MIFREWRSVGVEGELSKAKGDGEEMTRTLRQFCELFVGKSQLLEFPLICL